MLLVWKAVERQAVRAGVRAPPRRLMLVNHVSCSVLQELEQGSSGAAEAAMCIRYWWQVRPSSMLMWQLQEAVWRQTASWPRVRQRHRLVTTSNCVHKAHSTPSSEMTEHFDRCHNSEAVARLQGDGVPIEKGARRATKQVRTRGLNLQTLEDGCP